MRFVIYLTVIGFVCLNMLVGCASYRVSKPMVVGTYSVTYEPYPGTTLGSERLTLKADGTYKQEYRPRRGKPVYNSGKWSIDTYRGEESIHFFGLMQVLDEWGTHVRPKPRTIDTWLPIESRGRAVTITINDDLAYYYRKTM